MPCFQVIMWKKIPIALRARNIWGDIILFMGIKIKRLKCPFFRLLNEKKIRSRFALAIFVWGYIILSMGINRKHLKCLVFKLIYEKKHSPFARNICLRIYIRFMRIKRKHLKCSVFRLLNGKKIPLALRARNICLRRL